MKLPSLVDSFGRGVSYARISVTDRCDLRCTYCMAEQMRFLPRSEVLGFEEIVALADILIARGVRKIRLTGGEPLVRRGIEQLVAALGRRLGHGLDELVMTSNGTQLSKYAPALADAGMKRINVSLDSRDPERFAAITRRACLDQVLGGIRAANAAGLSVKINMVALKGVNEDEIESMARWCGAQGHALTLIETMPLGDVEGDRMDSYLPLDAVKRRFESRFTLIPSIRRSGGPARYYDVPELGLELGMITPLTSNFCSACNRIRITATGTVFGCLGHDQKVELRDLLRSGGRSAVNDALDALVAGKPKRHDFQIGAAMPSVARHMSVTGG